MATTIQDVVTGIAVQIARTTQFPDGSYPFKVRDLDDTPLTLEQGDCPQVFFHPQRDKEIRLTFDRTPGNPGHIQRPFTILCYFIDVSENLDQPWASRPRTTAWCDSFIAKISQDDALGIDDLHIEASAEVRDGLKFNEIPFRGGIITLSGFWFT